MNNETSGVRTRWFSSNGSVEMHGDLSVIYVGGTLIGSFGPEERLARNVAMLGLAENPGIKKEKLAPAFGISSEHLRRMRRKKEQDGLESVSCRGRGGSEKKLSANQRKRLHGLFAEGTKVAEAHRRLGERCGVSYKTVWREHKAWAKDRTAIEDETAVVEIEATAQQVLAIVPATVKETEDEQRVEDEQLAETAPSEAAGLPSGRTADDFDDDEGATVAPLQGGKSVQHAGGWLLLAMVQALGLYDAVELGWEASGLWRSRMRLVMDAVIMALGLGERCVEGVRRLATKSAALLLRASNAPSESWTRRVLHRYAEDMGGAKLQLRMTGTYLQRAGVEENCAAVFYVDNHMRPYTGKNTLRKGWRMQDKRVRPGATDYYVHDEDGRPVLRIDVAEHGSLTEYLTPIAQTLRAGLGQSQRLLVAFDRGGAFAAELAELRDAGIEFVTYERRPYPLLAATAFADKVTIDDEEYWLHENRLRNLGRGRGRVRRICVRTPEGRQLNLLAVTEEPAWRLLEIMLGRWVQENGFKHGNERWGINQLDGRKVEPYAPETVIPNPARRRLDNALRLARHREGDARRKLAHLEDSKKNRKLLDQLEREIAESVSEQEKLETLRPSVPKKVPLSETELAGDLVHHDSHYKTVLDTVRIACANAESDLATVLAPHLSKPAEAKKALANLFAAPGSISVTNRAITVSLAPAGRKDELLAFCSLFDVVNGWKLTLPGDSQQRPLCFKTQL